MVVDTAGHHNVTNPICLVMISVLCLQCHIVTHMASHRMSVDATSADDTSADLVVIGLGAMGSATADAAARLGHTVIGLEAFAQGHGRGSSHGPTRVYPNTEVSLTS